jgi:GNAT superfamily N-acetyltransferase
MKIVPVDAEIRDSESFQQLRRAWPELLFHDAVSNANWGRLYEERPEFQFALVDDDRVLAEGNSIPVAGMPAGWRDALRDGFDADEPDRLCALAILIDPDVQQRGLSRMMLEHMRGLAQARDWELVAPVRPTLKHRYPLTPIERYAKWRREDGLLFDPWLRAHERLGARRDCAGLAGFGRHGGRARGMVRARVSRERDLRRRRRARAGRDRPSAGQRRLPRAERLDAPPTGLRTEAAAAPYQGQVPRRGAA